MFEKCDSCTKPSKECIPRVLSMSAHDQREWCKMWQKRLGWSKRVMAEKSGVPEGTLSGVLGTSETREPAITTMHAIIGALTGCPADEIFSCVSEIEREIATNQAQDYERLSSECSRQQEEIKELERCCAEQLGKIHGMEEVIKQLEVENRILETKVVAAEKVEKHQEETIAGLKEDNKRGKRSHRFASIFGASTIILAVFLFKYVKLDANHLNIGLIRDPLMVPLAITVSAIILFGSIAAVVMFVALLRKDKKEE